jgi:hypothetical protein
VNALKVLSAVLLALAISLFLVDPGYAEASNFVSALVPAGICIGLVAKLAEGMKTLRAREALEAAEQADLKHKLEAAERKKPEKESLHDQPLRVTVTCACPACTPPVSVSPMTQLKAVALEHGLPINVSTPVSAGGPIGHVCKGPDGHPRYYQDVSYCPEHRDQGAWAVITPPQKSVPLPNIAGLSPGQIMLAQALCNDMLAKEAEPETRPEDLLPDPVAAADEAVEAYVPEGEAEMLEALRKHLRSQWGEARAARKGMHVPYPGNWEMSPAWAADVRKLRDLGGKQVWPQSLYTLYGYPVKTDISYGAPVLRGA